MTGEAEEDNQLREGERIRRVLVEKGFKFIHTGYKHIVLRGAFLDAVISQDSYGVVSDFRFCLTKAAYNDLLHDSQEVDSQITTYLASRFLGLTPFGDGYLRLDNPGGDLDNLGHCIDAYSDLLSNGVVLEELKKAADRNKKLGVKYDDLRTRESRINVMVEERLKSIRQEGERQKSNLLDFLGSHVGEGEGR